MIPPGTVAAALWLVWLAGWWLGAIKTARTVARQSYFLAGLYPSTPIVAWIGVVLVALGLAYAVWARLHLGRMWSAVVTVKAEHRIVKTGPYTLTRHPIYTGSRCRPSFPVPGCVAPTAASAL